MRRFLVDRAGEGQDRVLAGLIMESVAGDEIVVDSVALQKNAWAVMGQGECSNIKIILDKVAVEAERQRLRGETATAVVGRLVGVERNSPKLAARDPLRHGTPGQTPGSRSFEDADLPAGCDPTSE